MAFPRPRTATIAGWSGFDGGYRRAVSFAKYSGREVEDDDGPVIIPGTCWATYGDILSATVTGVALCGCFVLFGAPDRFFSATGWTGVNGANMPLAATSPGDPANTGWSGIIGTITLQEFDGSTVRPIANCDGATIGAPFAVDVVLEVTCFASQNGGLQADMVVNALGGTAGQVFESTDHAPETYFQPGDVVPNIVTCTVNGIGYYNHVAAAGNLTILAP